jgi:hypothetical protein
VDVEAGDHGRFDKHVRPTQECVYPVVGRMSQDVHSWPNRLAHRCQQNHQLVLVVKPPSDHGTFVDPARGNLQIEIGRLGLPAEDLNGNKDVSERQWRLFFFANPA